MAFNQLPLGIVSSQKITAPSFPDGLVIWNKFENLTSEVGSNFTGTPNSYQSAKFNNGVFINNSANKISASSVFDTSLAQAFCVEFWYKPNFSSSASTRYPIISQPDSGLQLFLFWFEGGNWRAGYRVGETGQQVIASDSFNTNDLIHFGLVGDNSGIDGSGDKFRLYIDGVDVGSYTNGWTTSSLQTSLTIGSYWDDSFAGNGLIDNLKVWDYAKTDFSDRNIEGF